MSKASAKIKVLEGLDHVRLRPEMYIGSTYDPAHLVTEILDNALDELANDYADKVTVAIKDQVVTVTDNGRGIPVHNVDGFDVDSIVIAATELFSGAKFDNKAYGVAIGLHGVGLAVTNALSEWLVIEVINGSNLNRYEFVNSTLTKQTTRQKTPNDQSTSVSFKPNSKFFTTMGFREDAIRKRLYLISARVSNSTILFNNEIIPKVTMNELARYYLDIEEDHYLTSISAKRDPQSVTMYISYDNEKTSMGDINLNICTGTYLTTLTTLFVKQVSNLYPTLTRGNITSGLKIYCSAFIQDPRFEGQVKNKMVKDISPLLELLVPRMKALVTTPFFKAHFEEIIEKKALAGASKKLKKVKMVGAGNPLKDCENKPGDTLYIVEGDSAGGNFFKFRDGKTEAYFPLSGKIMNSANKNINEVLSSKKMKYFLEAIGIDPLNRNQSNFRYKDVVIVCDADSDGGHIIVLVILALWKFAPALIRNGNLKILLPPLYGTYVNKQFIPIYDGVELAKYRSQGLEISRFKGLGEMDASELEAVVRAGTHEYQIEPPKDDDTEFAIMSCITNTDLKRKLCNDIERYNLQRIFDAI